MWVFFCHITINIIISQTFNNKRSLLCSLRDSRVRLYSQDMQCIPDNYSHAHFLEIHSDIMWSGKVACIQQRHGNGVITEGASKHHIGGGSCRVTRKPISVDCGVNQPTLSTKRVLIDSNDLPVMMIVCVWEKGRGRERERERGMEGELILV